MDVWKKVYIKTLFSRRRKLTNELFDEQKINILFLFKLRKYTYKWVSRLNFCDNHLEVVGSILTTGK